MKNILARGWQKIKLPVIILLSVAIGISWTISYTQFTELKKESEAAWNEVLKLHQPSVRPEADIKNTIPKDGESGDKVSALSNDSDLLRETEAKNHVSPPGEVENKILAYFKDDYQTAKAVFTAESKLDQYAQGWNCRYNGKSAACKPEDRGNAWSVDCGLAQINVAGKTCPKELFDIDENLKVARKKYDARKWQPWCAYSNGSYLAYLNN